MTWLVVGASSGVGRALAERFAAAGHALVLVSSDLRDVTAVASDLALRHGVRALPVALDLAQTGPSLDGVDAALAQLAPLTGILLPAGGNRATDAPGQSRAQLDDVVRTNFLSLAAIVDHCLARVQAAGNDGVVVGFGSITECRSRTRNAAYAAAKRALAAYLESVRHALAGSGGRVQYYVLGYVDTGAALGHRTLLPKASPQAVAERVYRRIARDCGRTYYPRYWRPVCLALRLLPWALFRRLSF